MNLLIGVLFYNFENSRKKTKHKYLTDDQLIWIKLQREILNANYDFKFARPKYRINKFFYIIINNKKYEFFSFLLIFTSCVLLTIDYDGSPPNYKRKIIVSNTSLDFIFIIDVNFFLNLFNYYIL